ncbi:iron complex transport system ATP-binding protein [Cruoricaptor ignavus]|uniref:ABC transporter ATP-binding protein n=1 Tax=Cruoricaptor ignavus TaxID=1118202 RepID=A0A1M6EFV2_9FLAO|nr:ABC transporter ATP-binding protein [Cruoricaptor ignavus]QOR74286.1 ABC transporter ATP-binding protein [Cruoricaptor ignavus]SHI84303.1 iron complex transport system ATP-binding protein [Cruoricaptor ignavus]
MFLKFNNAEIGYQQPLIRNVNCGLERGEVVLLIGDNGSGKTTLFKSILNSVPLRGGGIFLDNANISRLSRKEIAKKAAAVLSRGAIPAHLAARDLVAFGRFIHYPYYFKISEDDNEMVERILIDLGLKKYSYTPLRQLSDGNLQKAFIGRALAQNSPAIILDEPTAHLDEKNKLMILKLLRRLAQENSKAILLSSHDWRLAMHFADRIWLISNREISESRPDDFFNKFPELKLDISQL